MVTELNQNIKQLRDDKKLSQTAFAKEIGVSLSIVKKWEKGTSEPGIDSLQKICEKFSCDMDYLTGRLRERKHDFADVCKITGLSEESVKILIQAKKSGYAKAISHLIESKGTIKLMHSYKVFYDLLNQLEYVDTNYKSPGSSTPDYRIRANGQIVMNTDEAIRHYITQASRDLIAICNKCLEDKVKTIRRRSLDDDKFLQEEIDACEKELESLKQLKEWREKNSDE